MTLVFKNCNKATPVKIGTLTEEDEALLATAASLRELTGEAIATNPKYVQSMVSMLWDANKYIDVQGPY